MSTNRRDFLKGVAGASAITFWSNDIVSNLLAETPPGRVMESKFKGMADIVLGEAKLGGCSYADVRFTLTANPPGAMLNYRADAPDGAAAGGRGGRGRVTLARCLRGLRAACSRLHTIRFPSFSGRLSRWR